jgi:hypothetical protein
MTHPIDLNDAAQLGWGIEPRFEARKGDQVLRGTAADLTTLIAEHEEREAMELERQAHRQREHHHVPISRLVRRLGAFKEEHQRAWDKYLDESRDHYTRMQELESATKMRKRQAETLEQLFEHPNEMLLANDDFRELQAAPRES